MILHPTGSCPKNVIIPDFYGANSIPKYFVMFCDVDNPFRKLSSKLAIKLFFK